MAINTEHHVVVIASRYENKVLRILDICWSSALRNYQNICIDVFSGQAFRIAEVASKIARFREKKLIYTLHGGKLPEFYQQYPKRVERLFRKADRILTPSLYLKQFFQGKGFTVDYLPNSIDLGRFPYAKKRCNTAKLLWVRAFSLIYQPALAVETLYQVRKAFPEATLTMVGPDKGELQKTKDLIKKLQMDEAVVITGPVPNDVLYEYYHSHCVFLNTTAYESFGVAVMEAAACGIPIISSKIGEIPYLWKHETEIMIVDQPNGESFAQNAIRILSDHDLAQRLSLNARQKAEQFDWEVIRPRWIQLLENT